MEPETIQTDQNLSARVVQNPTGRHKRSPAQVAVSLQNMAKMTGRPRRIQVEWATIRRLRGEGYSFEQIAARLHVSRWTLRRWMAGHLAFQDPPQTAGVRQRPFRIRQVISAPRAPPPRAGQVVISKTPTPPLRSPYAALPVNLT